MERREVMTEDTFSRDVIEVYDRVSEIMGEEGAGGVFDAFRLREDRPMKADDLNTALLILKIVEVKRDNYILLYGKIQKSLQEMGYIVSFKEVVDYVEGNK
jgi:hypothetical protein